MDGLGLGLLVLVSIGLAVEAYCSGRLAPTQPKMHGAWAREPALRGGRSAVRREAHASGTWGASPAEAGFGENKTLNDGKNSVTSL